MKRQIFRPIRMAYFVAALVLALNIGRSATFAQGEQIVAVGFGEATAAPFIAYLGHDGITRRVPSVAAVGNRITFSFIARKRENGQVMGDMQLVDHTLGQVISSDVTELDPHPTHARPVGSSGSSTAQRIRSSTRRTVVDGQLRDGWRFIISPIFDGNDRTADTVCFELFNAEGVLVRQWSAIVSSGKVRILD